MITLNPLLDPKFFIPDGEAHVMPDGRLYLYGSMDLSGQQSYCSSQYHVFSTNDPALRNWVDHGISFSSCPEHMAGLCPEETILYAPDAACRDGKYYLYFCTSDGTEGVAFSDTPYGPFTSPKAIEGASGDSIDPAVFVDQDGQAYYFWGQFNLKGAKMNPDMCTLDLSSVTTGILTEQEHGFHEGACIRRRGDKYYLVYTDISRGRATCLGYAMADSPLGPYRKCGILIDNTGCDPQSWNNHGSIEEFQGQWYVFYHRSSQNGIFSRRMCAEPIYFRPDGTIAEVEQTSGGAEGPLDAFSVIPARIACRMTGECHIIPTPEGEILTQCGGGPAAAQNGWLKWAEFKYLDFGKGAVKGSVTVKGKGKLYFRTIGNQLIGQCNIQNETFSAVSFDANPSLHGILPLWILFDGEDIQLKEFAFEKAE